MPSRKDTPFFLDFAFELPAGLELEASTQARDCVTWGTAGCDDD